MKDSALEIIARHAQDGARLREEFFRAQASDLREAALRAALCLAGGGKILLLTVLHVSLQNYRFD